jgi:hypothetical protein
MVGARFDDSLHLWTLDERLFKIRRQYLVHFQGSRLCISFGEAKRRKVILALWEVIFSRAYAYGDPI